MARPLLRAGLNLFVGKYADRKFPHFKDVGSNISVTGQAHGNPDSASASGGIQLSLREESRTGGSCNQRD